MKTLTTYAESKIGKDHWGRMARVITEGKGGTVVATITNLPRSVGEKQWYLVQVPGIAHMTNDNLAGARKLAYTLLQHKEAGVT